VSACQYKERSTTRERKATYSTIRSIQRKILDDDDLLTIAFLLSTMCLFRTTTRNSIDVSVRIVSFERDETKRNTNDKYISMLIFI
jgi:hypothetical protein